MYRDFFTRGTFATGTFSYKTWPLLIFSRASNLAEIEMLKRVVCNHITGAGDTLTLRLFNNDIFPTEGDTWLGFSESDGTGYSSKVLRGDSWSFHTGDSTYAYYPEQTFSYSGGDTVFGYYLTTHDKDGDTIVLGAIRFDDGPYAISPPSNVNVTVNIRLS